jgi:hypothetical protein
MIYAHEKISGMNDLMNVFVHICRKKYMHEKISGMNDFYYLIPVAFLDSASSLAFLMHTQARVGAVSCRVKASSDGGLSEGASEDTSTSESPTLRDRMAPDDRHESDGLRVSIPLLSLGGDSSAR